MFGGVVDFLVDAVELDADRVDHEGLEVGRDFGFGCERFGGWGRCAEGRCRR